MTVPGIPHDLARDRDGPSGILVGASGIGQRRRRRRRPRLLFPTLVCAFLALFVAKVVGSWWQYRMHLVKLSEVKVGWATSEVLQHVGEPRYKYPCIWEYYDGRGTFNSMCTVPLQTNFSYYYAFSIDGGRVASIQMEWRNPKDLYYAAEDISG